MVVSHLVTVVKMCLHHWTLYITLIPTTPYLSLLYKRELKPGTHSKVIMLCLPTSTHSIMLY